MRSGSIESACMASASVIPSRSVRRRAKSALMSPTSAREPRHPVAKRGSSAVIATTSTERPGAPPEAAQAIDGLDRGEHAVDAIERTGVERGVEVGADEHAGPAGAAALETTECIPDRVATRAETRIRHPSLDQPETFFVELGVALARDALIRRCGADARQTRDPLVQAAHVSSRPCQTESAGGAPGRTNAPSINP